MPGALGTVYGAIHIDAKQAVAAYVAVRAQNAKTVYTLRGAGDSFLQSGRTMAAAGGLMLYAFGKAVSAAAQFQRRMDFFGAITNANKKQVKDLSKFVLELGQNSIFSVNDIADGMIELGKAGIGTKDILDGIGKAMVNLSTSADIGLTESGQIITSTIKTFDLQARDAIDVVNELQGAANATIADVSDIGVSLKYVGGIAATTGISLSDTVDAISLLAQAGIRGSTAGTSLRQMLVSLGGATKPAHEELTKLGIITKDGTNLFYTQAGNIKSLGQVYQILQDHTKNLNNQQRLAALRTIFNNRALAAASILTRSGAKGFAEMNRAIGKTTAAEIAHKRLDNLAGDVKKLHAAIEVFLVRAGSPFQEKMRGWVQGLTRLIKAFGKLDPQTQKNIIQFIGMTGALLLAMGAFNIIVGTMLKFIANLIQMGAAIGFVFKWIKILVFNLRWLVVLFGGELAAALGISVGLLLVIVAVIAAVAIAAVVLYKKWKPFRDIVDKVAGAIWNAIKAFAKFIATIAKDPGKAWDNLKNGAKDAIDAIGRWFASLPGMVWKWLQGAVRAVGRFVAGVAAWFAQLPGKVVGLIVGFVSKVMSLLTFRNLGYVIGFMIGSIIRLWYLFMRNSLRIIGNLVQGVWGFFRTLPGKIGFAIGFLIGRAIRLWYKFMSTTLRIIGRMISRVISFFARLPGRVGRFIQRMVTAGVRKFVQFAQNAPRLARQLVTNVITFMALLPTRVQHFIQRMVTLGLHLFQSFKTKAINFGKGLARGFIDALQGLPGTVSGILGKVIQAFKDVITQGFNAAKDFAGGLWSGFKKGLGINSPSFIEKHMYQMNHTLNDETKKMARNTARIQKIGQKWVGNTTTFGASGSASGSTGYRDLAMMHQRNLRRAGTVSTNPRVRSAARDASRRARPNRGPVPFHIDNWHEGRGHMADIAADVYDDNDDFGGSIDRMDN